MKDREIEEWETIRDAGHDLFFAVLAKDPLIYDNMTLVPLCCYWCHGRAIEDETTVGFIHESDCLWGKLHDFAYEIA